VAIVLTPKGWIGRIDIHVPKLTTFHCPVEPAVASPEILAEAEALLQPELMAYCAELKAEYDAMHKTPEARFTRPFEDGDFDVYDEGPIFGDDVICPDCGVACEYQGGEDVFGILGLQVYCCTQSCGNFIVIADPHSCELYSTQDAPRRRKAAPWQSSFWKFWRNK
jgi:hypothetical protein